MPNSLVVALLRQAQAALLCGSLWDYDTTLGTQSTCALRLLPVQPSFTSVAGCAFLCRGHQHELYGPRHCASSGFRNRAFVRVLVCARELRGCGKTNFDRFANPRTACGRQRGTSPCVLLRRDCARRACALALWWRTSTNGTPRPLLLHARARSRVAAARRGSWPCGLGLEKGM